MSARWYGFIRSPSPSSSAPKRPATPTRRAMSPSRIRSPSPKLMSPISSGGDHGPAGHSHVPATQSRIAALSRSPVRPSVSSGSSARIRLILLICDAPWHCRTSDAPTGRRPRAQTAGSSARAGAAMTRADTRSSRADDLEQLVDQRQHRGVGLIGVLADRVDRVGADRVDRRPAQAADRAQRRPHQEPGPPAPLHLLGPFRQPGRSCLLGLRARRLPTTFDAYSYSAWRRSESIESLYERRKDPITGHTEAG